MNFPNTNNLGRFSLTPSTPIIAGRYSQWTFTFTVGPTGIDEGGQIVLNQKFPTDWQQPQFTDPGKEAYTAVTTTGKARLVPRFDLYGGVRPWWISIIIDVKDYHLDPGDTVTITLGDQSHGSPGIRAQSFLESAHAFRLLVDPTNARNPRLVDTIKLPIIPDETEKLVCQLPMQAVVGEPVKVFLRGEDKWGNPTPAPAPGGTPADIQLQWRGDGQPLIENNTLTFSAPSTGYLVAVAGTLSARSNPITACTALPKYQKYYGDLHGQSDATVGTGTEEEYFAFGRDCANLDFISHQGNDFQVSEEDWRRLNDTVKQFHNDGEYVVFPGFEWSGNSCAGGDRNIIYLDENQPIFRHSHWLVPEVPESETSPAFPADDLFKKIRQHCDIDKVVLGSHVGGRFADVKKYFDAELGPLIEIVSCWGVFEWLLFDAFEAGHIVGVMCNSDGHHGRPGSEGPGAGEFGITGGLTCVLAESKTRSAIFDALKNRRCYGTTGARINLDFTIDGQPMGSVINCNKTGATGGLSASESSYPLAASVIGTGPIESLELYRGNQVIQVVQPGEFAGCDDSNRLRISWKGSRIRGRGRRVDWSGHIAVKGAAITAAAEHSFDTPTNGITSQGENEIHFTSQTTGDTDGLDIILDDATNATLTFTSDVTTQTLDLSKFTGGSRRQTFDCGGLDMQLTIERYPMIVQPQTLTLNTEVAPTKGETTPYFVKATQVDGQMAWSSPIYLST